MERIVLGYDGSPPAEAALAWVAARAQRDDVQVDVVAVVDHGAADDAIDLLAQAETRLRAEAPGMTVDLHRLHGDVIDAIADFADDADMLVIGITTGHPLRAALAGWLPLRLTRLARIPVWLVPTGWVDSADPVTVGIADDASSNAALALAAEEAARSGRTLRLVHAWLMPAPALTAGPVFVDPQPEAVIADHRRVLTAAVERVVERHPLLGIETELIRDSDAAALLRFSNRSSSLLIGTHRRGLLTSTLLGSVAQDLLWRSECPVCVVPSALAHDAHA